MGKNPIPIFFQKRGYIMKNKIAIIVSFVCLFFVSNVSFAGASMFRGANYYNYASGWNGITSLPMYDNLTEQVYAPMPNHVTNITKVVVSSYQPNTNIVIDEVEYYKPFPEKIEFKNNGDFSITVYPQITSVRFEVFNGLPYVSGSPDYSFSVTDKAKLNAVNSVSDKMNDLLTNDNFNSGLSDIKKVINDNHNSALSQLKNINDSLTSVAGNTKNIADNLNTTKSPASLASPDYSKELEKNGPVQRTDPFFDNEKYFEESEHNIVTDEMPDMMEPKQWQGVEKPVEQISDDVLNPESELDKDNEFIQEETLQADIFVQAPVLEVEEMEKESELVKEIFEQDSILTKDEEMNVEKKENTEIYERDNFYEQTESFHSDSADYKVRWKSVNGVFQ